MTQPVIIALISVIPCTACFVGAAFVARCGKEGWGWLLCLGFLTAPPPSVMMRALASAQGTEAQRAETVQRGLVRSMTAAVPKAIAQPTP